MRIVRVFFDVNMGQAFRGLSAIMRQAGMNPQTYAGHVIFINRRRSKFKLLTQGYLCYYDNGDKRIPLQALQYLPKAFGGAELDLGRAMSVAIRKSLEKELKLNGQG